jgi:hypothetical protein
MVMDVTPLLKKKFPFSLRSRFALTAFWGLLLLNEAATAQRIVLKDAATPIAEQPSPKSRVIAVLVKGDTVRVLKITNPWVQVAFRGKQKGWMYVGRSTASTNKNAPATTPETAAKSANAAPVEEIRPVEQTTASQSPIAPAPIADGGVSFHLGAFSRQFTYVGKFYYRTLPRLYVEGTFQYVAGDIASFYLMYGNAKYARPLGRRLEGSLTAGVGVINSVPVRAAGVKSVSNMVFNYGLGVQRFLKNSNWLRLDIREYTVIRQKGLANFFEFTVGLAIGIRWSKL